MTERICKRCRTHDRGGARFCSRCGLEFDAGAQGDAKGDAELYLHEEILLIALRDEKGTLESAASMSYAYAMAGALMAELLLSGRISVEDGKKKLVNLLGREPIGDPLIDECLEMMAGAKRRRKLNDWVSKFAQIRHLRHRAAEPLCERGILQASEDKVLLVFSRKLYPTRDGGPEQRMLKRLRDAIFADRTKPDPRTTVLLALASGADLLKIPFDKKALKQRKARIEKIVNGDLIGQAAKEVIQAPTSGSCLPTTQPISITESGADLPTETRVCWKR